MKLVQVFLSKEALDALQGIKDDEKAEVKAGLISEKNRISDLNLFLEAEENGKSEKSKLIDRVLNGNVDQADEIETMPLYRVYSITENSTGENLKAMGTKIRDFLEERSSEDKLSGVVSASNRLDGLLGDRKKGATGKIGKAIRRRLKSGESIEDVFERYEKKLADKKVDKDEVQALMAEYKLNYEFMYKELEQQDQEIEANKMFNDFRHKWEDGKLDMKKLQELHEVSESDSEKKAITNLADKIDSQVVIQKNQRRNKGVFGETFTTLRDEYLNDEKDIVEIEAAMYLDEKNTNEQDLVRGAAIAVYWDIIDGKIKKAEINNKEEKLAA